MAIVFEARDATRDIDAKYRSSVELRRVIKSISDDFEIDEGWLNNDGEHYVTNKMSTSLYLDFSNLKVYTVNADYLLWERCRRRDVLLTAIREYCCHKW